MGLIKRTKIQEGVERLLTSSEYSDPSRGGPGRPPRSVAELTTEELQLLGPVRDEADRILEEARSNAEDVIAEARREAERLQETSRSQGFARGEEMAKRELTSKSAEILEVLNGAVKQRRKIIGDAESEILRISLKAAEQIVKSEVSLHRDVCMNIIAEAINRVSDREQITIRVSHEDLENVKRMKDRIASLVDGVKTLSILEDASVDPGGAIIETNLGYVDARISTKLEALERAIHKVQSGPEE